MKENLLLPDGCAAAAINIEASNTVHWHDRVLGQQVQDVPKEVGDFVLRRADALWAYQLAVVLDDGDQGITHVVRGQDLADNTPRQILLQRALQLPTPSYMHIGLVMGENGEKLSKQNGASAIDLTSPRFTLAHAAQALGLPIREGSNQKTACHQQSLSDDLTFWVNAWRARWGETALVKN